MATVTENECALNPAEMVRRWDTTIAARFLPQTRLIDAVEEGWYVRFVVDSEPGRTNLVEIIKCRHRIAAAFGVKPHQIQASSNEHDLPSRFQLTVALQDPVQKVLVLDQPCGTAGVVPMGPYFDGRGEAGWRLHQSGRTYSGVGIGGARTGKTELTKVLAVGSRATLPTSLVYIDGRDGLECPELAQHAELSGELVEVEPVLRAVERLARKRLRRLREQGVGRVEVTEEDPLVLVLIDNAQDVFEATGGDRWARLVWLGDKTAVSVAATVNQPTISSFGCSTDLRTLLTDGNSMAFHTPAPWELRNSATRLDHLPNIPGVGLHVVCDGDAGRDFRVRWVGEHLAGLLEGFPGAKAGLGEPPEALVPSRVPLLVH